MFIKRKRAIVITSIVFIILCLIGLFLWYLSTHVRYFYDTTDGESYEIVIDYRNGKTIIDKTSFYTVSDDNAIHENYELVITKDEGRLFKQAVSISPADAFDALIYISENDRIMISNVEKPSYDYNKDGQVTYREYGNYLLNTILEQEMNEKGYYE